VGSAEERFVQAVRLASCDLTVKTEGGQVIIFRCCPEFGYGMIF
jgi:hypothetical protein